MPSIHLDAPMTTVALYKDIPFSLIHDTRPLHSPSICRRAQADSQNHDQPTNIHKSIKRHQGHAPDLTKHQPPALPPKESSSTTRNNTPQLPRRPRNQPKSSSTTPSADHAGLFPLVHNHAAAIPLTSHEARLAIGGYSLPSLSTVGSHVHLSPAGTPSITAGTWFPHPHQVVFSKEDLPSAQWKEAPSATTTLTARIAGSFSAHGVY
ncbi:Kelch repeat-containing protein 3 [Metarhizium acridum]|nr:Kelch repeat-containing protein 3 [Metarhizium acridum]